MLSIACGLVFNPYSWAAQDTGVFSQKSEQKSAQEQMITNPDMMSNMMKQNLSGIVPQVPHSSSFLDTSCPMMNRSLRGMCHRVLLPRPVFPTPMLCA